MATVLQEFQQVAAHWAGGASAAGKSLPGAATVGSRIVAISRRGDGSGTGTVVSWTDNGSTVYTLDKRQADTNVGTVLEFWSGIAISTSAGQNAVCTQNDSTSSADDVIALYELSDPDVTQIFGATNTNGASTSGTTTHDSGNVTPAVNGAVIVGMSSGSNRTWTEDPDFVADLVNGRTTLSHLEQGTAAVIAYTPTSDTNAFAAVAVVAYEGTSGGANPPSITDVDEDNTIVSTQANVEIDGTDFDTATVEIEQEQGPVAQSIDSQNATTIVFDTVFMGAGAEPDLRYGSATLRVVNGDAQEDTIAITITAPSGFAYVTIGTPDTEASNRITAVADIAGGDQLEWSNVQGGTEADVIINDDGTFECDAAVTAFDVRCWDSGDGTWGTAATQSVSSPSDTPPVFSGPIPDQEYTKDEAITPLDATAYFTGATSYSLLGSLPTGLSFNTSSGALTGTPTEIGTFPGITITGINVDGDDTSNAFTIFVATNEEFSSGGGNKRDGRMRGMLNMIWGRG